MTDEAQRLAALLNEYEAAARAWGATPDGSPLIVEMSRHEAVVERRRAIDALLARGVTVGAAPRDDVREILDAMVALFREFQDAAIEWRAGEKRPLSDSIAHVATMIGKLGDCHVRASARRAPEGPTPSEAAGALALAAVMWDGAGEDGCGFCGGEYADDEPFVLHEAECAIVRHRLELISQLVDRDPAPETDDGKRLVALVDAQEKYEIAFGASRSPEGK
jgi:hypothetical protein